MAATLYLGVRLPEKPYERLKLNDINFSTKKVSELKVDAEKLLNFSREQLGRFDVVIFISKFEEDKDGTHLKKKQTFRSTQNSSIVEFC